MPSLRSRLKKQHDSAIPLMIALAKNNESIGELITALENHDVKAQQTAAVELGVSTRNVAKFLELYLDAADDVLDGGA